MSQNDPGTSTTLAAKKAAVLGTSSRSRKPLAAAVVIVLLAAGAAAYFLTGAKTSLPAAAGVAAIGDVVAIPVATLDDGKARYFEHRHDDLTIRYFAIKSADGVIRAAFDACDVCYPYKKGYHQAGNYMQCNNCGRKFRSDKINVLEGGCNPSPLERKVVDGRLVITTTDLEAGARYFL